MNHAANHVAFSATMRLTAKGWVAQLNRDAGTPHIWRTVIEERDAAERWLVNAIGELLYAARDENAQEAA